MKIESIENPTDLTSEMVVEILFSAEDVRGEIFLVMADIAVLISKCSYENDSLYLLRAYETGTGPLTGELELFRDRWHCCWAAAYGSFDEAFKAAKDGIDQERASLERMGAL